MSRKNKLRFAAACAAALVVSQSARATDYSWTNATDGNWTDANWTPTAGAGTTFPVAGDTAIFNANGVNGAETIFLNGNEAASSLTFNNSGATTISTGTSGNLNNQQLMLTGGMTVNSGAGKVSIGGSGNSNVVLFVNGNVSLTNNLPTGTGNRVTFNNGQAATTTSVECVSTNLTNVVTTQGSGDFLFLGSFRNNTLNGNIGLVCSGTGFVELDGSSSQFGDGVVLNSGTLGVKSSTALGTTANKSFTMNGGTYEAVGTTPRTLPAGVNVTFGGSVTLGTDAHTGVGLSNTFTGNVTLSGTAGNPTAADTLNLLNSNTWLGTSSGTGGITIENTLAGNPGTTLNMQNVGTWTGTTTVLANTTFFVNPSSGSDLFPTSSPLVVGTGGTFQASSVGTMPIASLSDQPGGGGGIILMGNGGGDNMLIGSDNTTTTFSGIFTGNDTAGSGGVTKVGTGTLKLAGASTFNGYTAVTNGTLAFTTIGNIGVPGSSLLAPNTAALATIALGAATTTGTLQYVGSMSGGASTDRVINLAGATGGGAIDASGSTTITFTSNLTASGVGAKTLTLTGTNTGANTLGGAIPDSSGGATSLAKTGVGAWILTGASTYTGSTSVSDGKLTLDTNLTTSTSVAVTGGTLELGALQTRVIQTPTVSVSGTGKLDVQDNKMIVSNTPIGTATGGVYDSGSMQGMIQSGRNGGKWNGVGIVSSQATAAGAVASTTLGADVASDVTGVSSGTTLWAGQTVNPTDTLVKYTYAGDANLNGSITGDDYFKIDNGLANHLTGYANGDFNYDGVVNADDYFIIDKNYVQQTTAFPSGAPLNVSGGLLAVPEPASVALLGLSIAGLFGRRRRNR